VSTKLRTPTDDDVATVVRLMSEHAPEPVGEDVVRRSWASPRFDLANDALIDGESYATVEDLGEGRVWIDLRGRPSAMILDWAEKRAGAMGRRLLAGGWASHESLLCELERRGYCLIRRSQRMAIDLADPKPDPDWPEGIETRTFSPGDERALYDAQQESFADSWEPIEESFEEWSHWLLEGPAFAPELWFLALDGVEIAGFAICHPHAGDPKTAMVRLLAVRRPWRRRGLGRALLLQAFGEFRRRGFSRAALGVDAESLTGANRLYEQAGMHVRATFDIYEKVLT
jgi:ribosomal protein S18 acetylase RimI-like enzyme